MEYEEIKVWQLPTYLKEQIVKEIQNYSVCLFAVKVRGEPGYADFIGSGTLAIIDGYPLILTAGHVLKNKDWDLTTGGEITHLCLAIADYTHAYKIPIDHLSCFGMYNLKSDLEGPDIGFLVLPESTLGDLKAKKSFYNLTGHFTRRAATAMKGGKDCWVVVGCPSEDAAEIVSEAQDSQKWDLQAMVGFCGFEGDPDTTDRDLLYASIIFDEKYEGPKDFRGVSGGGLWRIPLSISKSKRIEAGRALFSGVPFYQPPRKGDKLLIHCQSRISAVSYFREMLPKSRNSR